MVLSMDRWANKIAVVTGASEGIGFAISERLVKEGLVVVGLARRLERFEKLSKKLAESKDKFHAFRADVSNEEDILNAFKWIAENVGPVSILVNNAGVIKPTTLIEGDTEKWKAVLDTNVLGLSIATREAIEVMREHEIDGHIIHINSVAGHQVSTLPKLNMYSASKFAVTALTETLRQELNRIGSKIRITSISPGAVETSFAENGGFDVSDTIVKSINAMPSKLKGEDLADITIYVLSTPPHVQVHELLVRPVGQQSWRK